MKSTSQNRVSKRTVFTLFTVLSLLTEVWSTLLGSDSHEITRLAVARNLRKREKQGFPGENRDFSVSVGMLKRALN